VQPVDFADQVVEGEVWGVGKAFTISEFLLSEGESFNDILRRAILVKRY
jgi:hypothetical protein